MPEPEPETRTHTSSVLNRKAVKAFALECSQSNRNGKFTRVSEDLIRTLEIKVRRIIREHVSSHPSNGKTIEGLWLGEYPTTAKTRRRKA